MAIKGKSLLPRCTVRQPDIRPSARARGYDRVWEAFAKRWLKANPLCVDCQKEGRDEPATEVDHIIPLRQAPHRRLDKTNVQSLCHPHHGRKTKAGR